MATTTQSLSQNPEFQKIVDDAVSAVVQQLSVTNTRGRIDIQIGLTVQSDGKIEATVSTVNRALYPGVTDVGPVGQV